MLKRFLTALLLCLMAAHSFAFKMTPELLASADAGVAAIYNLDFDTASSHINKLLEQYPNFPIAMFGLTMIEWSRFEYQYEKSNPLQADIFEKSIQNSIKSIEEWEKQNKNDPYSYLALGGVYGVKSRFEIANRKFIKAYFSGKKGLKYMNKAASLDPTMYDAKLGDGVYQYYAGTLPAVVKVLAKLVVSGNAEKGIEYLNAVKDKGRFSADTAKLLLVEISIESDKYRNPALATEYIGQIIKKYPHNPLYRFVNLIAMYENSQYDDVIKGAQEFLSKIGKESFYNSVYTARSYTAIGTAQMAKGRYKEAENTFLQSIAATSSQEPSRWQLWNELRLAQTYDLLNQRSKASSLYKKISAQKQTWGIDEVASKYQKRPFTIDELGRMSPP